MKTQTTDPVCGMTVSPDTELRHVHAGTEYLFCSAGCRRNSPHTRSTTWKYPNSQQQNCTTPSAA